MAQQKHLIWQSVIALTSVALAASCSSGPRLGQVTPSESLKSSEDMRLGVTDAPKNGKRKLLWAPLAPPLVQALASAWTAYGAYIAYRMVASANARFEAGIASLQGGGPDNTRNMVAAFRTANGWSYFHFDPGAPGYGAGSFALRQWVAKQIPHYNGMPNMPKAAIKFRPEGASGTWIIPPVDDAPNLDLLPTCWTVNRTAYAATGGWHYIMRTSGSSPTGCDALQSVGNSTAPWYSRAFGSPDYEFPSNTSSTFFIWRGQIPDRTKNRGNHIGSALIGSIKPKPNTPAGMLEAMIDCSLDRRGAIYLPSGVHSDDTYGYAGGMTPGGPPGPDQLCVYEAVAADDTQAGSYMVTTGTPPGSGVLSEASPSPSPSTATSASPSPEPINVDVLESSVSPSWNGVNDYANIKITAPDQAWQLMLVTPQNNEILMDYGVDDADFVWYGTSSGAFVPSGTYKFKLTAGSQTAEDTFSFQKPSGSTYAVPAPNPNLVPSGSFTYSPDLELVYGAQIHETDQRYVWPYFDENASEGRGGGLLTHYLKHFDEFFSGSIRNPKFLRQYYEKATFQILNSPDAKDDVDGIDNYRFYEKNVSTPTETRKDRYSQDRATGTIAVLHWDGHIGTFFDPTDPDGEWLIMTGQTD